MPSITQQDYKRINIFPAGLDEGFENWGEEVQQQIATAIVNDTILDVVLEDNNTKGRILSCYYSADEDYAEISYAYEQTISLRPISDLSQYLPKEEIIN